MKSSAIRLFYLSLFLVPAPVLSQDFLQPGFLKISVTEAVKKGKGPAIDSVVVEVSRRDSVLMSGLTGKDGICRIYYTRLGKVNVTASKEFYAPAKVKGVVVKADEATFLHIEMKRKKGVKLVKKQGED